MSNKEKKCTGCGWSSLNPLGLNHNGESFLACCPDSNYVEVDDYHIGDVNKKISSVEWLIKKLQNRQNGIFDGFPHLSLDEIYEQAKAMHKEEIIQTFEKGYVCGYRDGIDYYNETFGGNNEQN
jgi:hypothetical protein